MMRKRILCQPNFSLYQLLVLNGLRSSQRGIKIVMDYDKPDYGLRQLDRWTNI